MRVKAVAPVLALLFSLAACTPTPEGVNIHDPYESTNRGYHMFNKGLDAKVISPLATGYTTVVPEPVTQGVSNFASNLALPGQVINNTLQADLIGAGQNTLRLLVNSTVGVLGLLDPASLMGLHEKPTDFGQTLAVWGVGEGAYLELPVLGPTNERDAVGTIVDMVLSPTSALEGDAAVIATVADAGAGLKTREDLR
ncbi:MAG: VacJ family lipoprotein, partial [Pseudomonadota bacterium]